MSAELTNPENPSNFYRPPHATVAQLKLFINHFTQNHKCLILTKHFLYAVTTT